MSTTQPLPLVPESLGLPGISRVYQPGRLAIVQGAACVGLFVVTRGILREGAVSEQGSWLVHDLHAAPSVFGDLVPGEPSPVSVRAIEESRVVVLRPADLHTLWRHRPERARWLFALVDRRLHRAHEGTRQLAWCEAAERLEGRLVDLARSCGRRVPGGVLITPLLTQDELAATIGATRETVNRAVVAMVADGRLRLEQRRYVVRDRLLARDNGQAPATAATRWTSQTRRAEVS